jgi:hypothetical protein
MLCKQELHQIGKLVYELDLRRRSHQRAATLWDYSSFWITLLTSFIAAAGGLTALHNPRAALVLGLTAAVFSGFATALQGGREDQLNEKHQAAASKYEAALLDFERAVSHAVRTGTSAEESIRTAAQHLTAIRIDSPRVKTFPFGEHCAAHERKKCLTAVRSDISALQQEPAVVHSVAS